ncbi:MAG: polyphosphate kinase 1 [Verrucomicrobia bacterium]|nr:MAG: polyphosphate kinase 1 [Verrucomicrobiota bacterium]
MEFMTKKASNYFNRELSWLTFNQRVLDEANNADRPLLTRLKFLAITGSNLDEFFMVRVGGLQAQASTTEADPAGLTPEEQLARLSVAAHAMVTTQYEYLLKELMPKLAAKGIEQCNIAALTAEQATYAERLFEHEIYPVVTPMALAPDSVFPLLAGLTVNLFVRLAPESKAGDERHAVVALPRALPRFFTLPAERGYHYLLLEDIVMLFLPRLFPGEKILECVPIRLTRNADLTVREDQAGDLLEDMKEILTERRQSACIRLEISDKASQTALDHLQAMLEVEPRDVYAVPGPLGLTALFRIVATPGFAELQEEEWAPQPSPSLRADESIFDAIARQDILLFHPYEGFDPVVRFVNEAADDPHVLAIKQILYRTSDNSPIVAALARAAEKDKHVTVLVELKARFDEARNIGWAESLERAGAQVIYGLRGLKVHAKACLVVRREAAGLRRYVHFGTGNYNEKTARIYSDVSLLTCNEDFGADASALFNAITGYAQPTPYRKLEAAPLGLRDRLLELIQNEAERCRQGQTARIVLKLNSLVDTAMIDALYEASQAGVQVQLNIRGICCLRPGVPELSENISVVSIIDRYLEHARILYFHNGGEPLMFISSADWMPRNLDRRVELLVPVEDSAAGARLLAILETCLTDSVQGRRLLPDGAWEPVKATGKRKTIHAQEAFFRQATDAAVAVARQQEVVFEPQRPAKPGN